jgi:uncharacterized membrane protein YeaQ/YmgE (transglycosylase-associated protein family)
MEWTPANLLIQIFTGILGSHAAAIAAKEHSFGVIGHTIVGAVGGALSGYFLQTLAATMVTGTGSLNEPRLVEQVILQVLTGAVAGAIAMLVVGFLKHGIDQHKSAKR